ncbi:bile acid-CoA:amino acid N-acyltransferase-like [Puntigrus tetrazona]|uniref:bile acid-CoA:amino acid N-acyltransferase-like n=1 Tax=Puntigrus tetrazona TaxID=1606681 RepID=UPI001C892754|nr:bile acid-CoA:amino acid N-acyltransferase-like [Puntigrus tetrazona]
MLPHVTYQVTLRFAFDHVVGVTNLMVFCQQGTIHVGNAPAMFLPVLTSGSASTQIRTCPLLSVQPRRGLVDEKFQFAVTNLKPNQKVTLHSLHQSDDRDFWEAFGHYVSDEQGSVTGFKDESLGGTYEGIEPLGLVWSMRPIPGSRHGLRLRKKDIFRPMEVHISVYSGHLSQGFSQQAPLATSVTERWYFAPGVKRVNIRENNVRGTLFLPPGPGPFPGVLDLWGASESLVEYRSSLLASHGFASMALEYLAPNNMKTEDTDASYFEKAYQILENHPMVQKDNLAVLGLCLGSAITLNMVSYSKVVKPQCCVCISGSHLMPLDNSLSELFEELKKHADKQRVNEDNQVIYKYVISTLHCQSIKVDVGRIKCPLLLVNGDDDQAVPVLESAEDMEMMMEKAGNRHLLEVLTYPDAGHLIEPPYSPHFRATNFKLQRTKERVVMLWGGKTKPHAHAQEDSWEKILSFLWQHLSAPVTSSI